MLKTKAKAFFLWVASGLATLAITPALAALPDPLIFENGFEHACPVEFPPILLCLELHYYEGLGYPELTQFLDVDYCPSTGQVFGIWGLEILKGNVVPMGPLETSIYSAGASFSFNSRNPETPEWEWLGAGLTKDTSGKFVGYWGGAEGSKYEKGTAPTDYTFTEGSCVPDQEL